MRTQQKLNKLTDQLLKEYYKWLRKEYNLKQSEINFLRRKS